MKLGLALSGGGFRATAYHLGVLARLAREDLLEDVAQLSTVSGGSLCIGMVFAINEFRWPGSQEYLEKIVPQAHIHMTTYNLQLGLLRRLLRSPWRLFQTKANDLSGLMRQKWGVTASLRDLPTRPRWMINATCYETGKNWRFERFRMGDYVVGYTNDVDIPLSDALAASAGFPGLIGPLVLKTGGRSWYKYEQHPDTGLSAGEADTSPARKTKPITPAFNQVHLWDGGVYDNQGLEALHDFNTGWREGIDFLVISDGSGKPKPEAYRLGAQVFLRIITGVMMDQIRSLRARAIFERIQNHGDKGVYLTIGNTCHEVIASVGREAELADLCQACLSDSDAERAGNFPTVIRQLTPDEFELLSRHGYEVADYTLVAYYPDQFKHVPYGKTM